MYYPKIFSRTSIKFSAPLLLLLTSASFAAPAPKSSVSGFEANRGQVAKEAAFKVRGPAYSAFLTDRGPVVAFRRPGAARGFAYRVEFLDSAGSDFAPLDHLSRRLHYHAPGVESVTVPTYGRVLQREIYPAIDVMYRLTGAALEYDFILEPGADPNQIRLAVEGPDSLRIDQEGRLVMASPLGDFHQLPPVAYQVNEEGRTIVEASYRLAEDGTVGFQLGDYDSGRQLIIDPVLDYSTYLGAGDNEVGNAVAVGPDGSYVLAGRTESSDFPISAGVFLDQFGGDASDAFITKFNPDGTIAFSAFYGAESSDAANDVAIGSDGSIYITGQTESESLPVSGFDEGFSGEVDCFVAKFSSDGISLDYASYLGDGDEDVCNAIALDENGEAVVAGYTISRDFPFTDGAPQNINRGGRDAFVARVSADGSELLYSTFLGGGGDDTAFDIALGTDGTHYVVGDTSSIDFPVSDDAQSNLSANRDAFLTVVSADGSTVMYSSFLGGAESDFASAVAVGEDGTIAVVGETVSSDFPVLGGTQGILGSIDEEDAFLTLMTDMGRQTVFSTFLGGGERDFATDVAIDSNGRIHVTGGTDSEGFPTTANALLGEARGERDAFITQFERAGGGILFSTFFGGEEDDEGAAIAAGSDGKVYVAGFTESDNFPLSDNAFQNSFNDFDLGGLEIPSEAFVLELSALASEAPLGVVSSATFSAGPVASGSIVSAFGTDLADTTESATMIPLPTELGDVQVFLTGFGGAEAFAELIFVSPEQINFVFPDLNFDGTIRVEILRDGEIVATGSVLGIGVQPGIFTADQSGNGTAAAFVIQDVNGEQMRSLTFDLEDDGTITPASIDLSAGDTIVELYATGIRGAQNVTATVNGQDAEVLFAGANPDFVGLDQVNVRIPQSLAGAGEATIVLTADGFMSNSVTIDLQ